MTLLTMEKVKALADSLVNEADATGKITQARAVDDMFYGNWTRPPEYADIKWLHDKIDTRPHDSLRQGTRALDRVIPKIEVNKHLSNDASKEVNAKIEKWLSLMISGTSSRNTTNLITNIVFAALAYDEVAVQVNYLPFFYNDEKLETMSEVDRRRIEAALHWSPFKFEVFHPYAVFVHTSDVGIEGVLTRKLERVSNLEREWGMDRTAVLREHSKEDPDNILQWATLYDYKDWNGRYVWAIPQKEDDMLMEPDNGWMILKEKRQETFMNWGYGIGGVEVTKTSLPARVPLLHSIIETGQWDDKNLMDTIQYSVVLGTAARPQFGIKNASGKIYRVEYWDPLIIFNLEPGDELVPMPLNLLDVALAQLSDKEDALMARGSLSDVLLGAPPPGGVAFSTMNQTAQIAGKALSPYKTLAEVVIAKVCKVALDWMIFMEQDLEIPFDSDPPVSWSLLDENPDIQVTLTEDMPVDQGARTQTAVNYVNSLGGSKEGALSQIGETDPQGILKEAHLELMKDQAVMSEIQSKQARDDMMAQMENAGLGMLAQLIDAGVPEAMQVLQVVNAMLMQAAQGEQEPPAEPGAEALPGPENQVSPENVANVPIEGPVGPENPAIQSAPGQATFEGATGQDRSGGPIR